jgi:hypothetical protein
LRAHLHLVEPGEIPALPHVDCMCGGKIPAVQTRYGLVVSHCLKCCGSREPLALDEAIRLELESYVSERGPREAKWWKVICTALVLFAAFIFGFLVRGPT